MKEKKSSDSHIKAVAKYNAKNYKTFSVNMKPEDYEKLLLVSENAGTGKSRLLIECFKYINENNIDIEEWIKEKNLNRKL